MEISLLVMACLLVCRQCWAHVEVKMMQVETSVATHTVPTVQIYAAGQGQYFYGTTSTRPQHSTYTDNLNNEEITTISNRAVNGAEIKFMLQDIPDTNRAITKQSNVSAQNTSEYIDREGLHPFVTESQRNKPSLTNHNDVDYTNSYPKAPTCNRRSGGFCQTTNTEDKRPEVTNKSKEIRIRRPHKEIDSRIHSASEAVHTHGARDRSSSTRTRLGPVYNNTGQSHRRRESRNGEQQNYGKNKPGNRGHRHFHGGGYNSNNNNNNDDILKETSDRTYRQDRKQRNITRGDPYSERVILHPPVSRHHNSPESSSNEMQYPKNDEDESNPVETESNKGSEGNLTPAQRYRQRFDSDDSRGFYYSRNDDDDARSEEDDVSDATSLHREENEDKEDVGDEDDEKNDEESDDSDYRSGADRESEYEVPAVTIEENVNSGVSGNQRIIQNNNVGRETDHQRHPNLSRYPNTERPPRPTHVPPALYRGNTRVAIPLRTRANLVPSLNNYDNGVTSRRSQVPRYPRRYTQSHREQNINRNSISVKESESEENDPNEETYYHYLPEWESYRITPKSNTDTQHETSEDNGTVLRGKYRNVVSNRRRPQYNELKIQETNHRERSGRRHNPLPSTDRRAKNYDRVQGKESDQEQDSPENKSEQHRYNLLPIISNNKILPAKANQKDWNKDKVPANTNYESQDDVPDRETSVNVDSNDEQYHRPVDDEEVSSPPPEESEGMNNTEEKSDYRVSEGTSLAEYEVPEDEHSFIPRDYREYYNIDDYRHPYNTDDYRGERDESHGKNDRYQYEDTSGEERSEADEEDRREEKLTPNNRSRYEEGRYRDGDTNGHSSQLEDRYDTDDSDYIAPISRKKSSKPVTNNARRRIDIVENDSEDANKDEFNHNRGRSRQKGRRVPFSGRVRKNESPQSVESEGRSRYKHRQGAVEKDQGQDGIREKQGTSREVVYAVGTAAKKAGADNFQAGEVKHKDELRGKQGVLKKKDQNFRRGKSTKGARDFEDWEEYGKRREYHYALGDKELPSKYSGVFGVLRSDQDDFFGESGGVVVGNGPQNVAQYAPGFKDRSLLQDSANFHVFGWWK